jgi:hypothetical protein
MTARRRLMAAAALAALVAGGAHAEQQGTQPLVPLLPSPGATLDEVRAVKWPEGRRLICDADDDKPAIAERSLLDPQAGKATRTRRCGMFGTDDNGAWSQLPVNTVGGPARLWLLFVESGGIGHYRLAQTNLWLKRAAWDKVAAALTANLGAPSGGSNRFLTWTDDQRETLMFLDEKRSEEFAVFVSDQRLHKLLRSHTATGRPE